MLISYTVHGMSCQNLHPPEKKPYTTAKTIAPAVLEAPCMAKMRPPVMTATAQRRFIGP